MNRNRKNRKSNNVGAPRVSTTVTHVGNACVIEHHLFVSGGRRLIFSVRCHSTTGSPQQAALLTLNKLLSVYYAEVQHQLIEAFLLKELVFWHEHTAIIPGEDDETTQVKVLLTEPSDRVTMEITEDLDKTTEIREMLDAMINDALGAEYVDLLPPSASYGVFYSGYLPIQGNNPPPPRLDDAISGRVTSWLRFFWSFGN